MAIRVLIVDDDPDVRLVLRTALGLRAGWEVVGEARDGSQVLDVAERTRPDVVILDLSMETPGDVVVPSLIRLLPECMVTVFSALPATNHRDRLLRLGAFSYIEKGQLGQLPRLIEAHHEEFRRALAGEDVVARWARTSILA